MSEWINGCWINLFMSFTDNVISDSGIWFFIISNWSEVVASQSVIRWWSVSLACRQSLDVGSISVLSFDWKYAGYYVLLYTLDPCAQNICTHFQYVFWFVFIRWGMLVIATFKKYSKAVITDVGIFPHFRTNRNKTSKDGELPGQNLAGPESNFCSHNQIRRRYLHFIANTYVGSIHIS